MLTGQGLNFLRLLLNIFQILSKIQNFPETATFLLSLTNYKEKCYENDYNTLGYQYSMQFQSEEFLH